MSLRQHLPRLVILGCLVILGPVMGEPTPEPSAGTLTSLEEAYADLNDAQGAVALIDSYPQHYSDLSFEDRSRADWQHIYSASRSQLLEGLPRLSVAGLDARARGLMRAAVEASPVTPDSLAPAGRCSDARGPQLAVQSLQQALYACFAELGNSLKFENSEVTRVAAFELLTRIEEPARRKALFLSFVPLWQALNGNGEADSPYRRMIRMAAVEDRRRGSPIDEAAHTLDIPTNETERWLVRILETWRQASGTRVIEPWDYRFEGGVAERQLAAAIPREALQALNQRYYADLGLDLAASRVVYDLDPRAGKAPLAYTDYVRRGRLVNGAWRPTLVRVSASYARGGIGPLNELVHENGHAAHMLALRTRPAFMDLGDPIFFEAFADVPSWSVYEPAWQQKYLGRSASRAASQRALYSQVMLDVAWALFDLRMLHEPGADPNAVWTRITADYLHIRPHPELAWWALRVQLVHKPGYMVNYGLGAVITADLRQRIAAQLGPFETGDARWYGWLAVQLLRDGEEHETRAVLRQFLGRRVSPEALIAALRNLAPQAQEGSTHDHRH